MPDHSFELAVMAVLVAASAFFSGSEAALFSLTRADRGDLASGSTGGRRAAGLLERPERLLTAILFWNLVVNLTYYALTEVVAGRIARAEGATPWGSTLFTLGALLVVILLSEVLPKSLAVLKPRQLSTLVSGPLVVSVRAIDPILPSLQSVSDAAARALVPRLEQEPYMQLEDLERAVEVRSDETLHGDTGLGGTGLVEEQLVLKRLVELADTTAAELMRPRKRCLVMRPPVALDDLVGRCEGVGEYVLFTESDSDEIAGALPLSQLAGVPAERIDHRGEPMPIVPWCAPAAEVLGRLREAGRRVAVVINELGETIGIVTRERLLDAVLRDSERDDPHDAHGARISPLDDGVLEASGGAALRRVAKLVGPWVDSDQRVPITAGEVTETLGALRSRTVGGLLQERLERPARRGDRVLMAGLLWSVVAGSDDELADDPITVRIEVAVGPLDGETPDGADPEEGSP